MSSPFPGHALDLPQGTLVRSRVVSGVGTVLADALERDLTGYAVLAPQSSLLLDDAGRGVVTFEAGVPVLAYHTASDVGGAEALADLPASGPCRAALYRLDTAHLETVHDTPALRVPPGMPAERLAGDHELAERTRERAPDDRGDAPSDGPGAVEAFLADEERIEAIRAEARSEAARRADEWGLDDQLADEGREVTDGDEELR
ncbi:hypothetical protein [Halomarina litorea]|uniref:hypothetical protein n=1 Tax=Halomarina litorea TaxID=2961595 RepID=UPI0020C4B0ED|nr:hypothetical protein [Halomarina sp. BCD28]